MPWLAFYSLVVWPVVVFVVFEKYSAQKAIVWSIVGAWLFLAPIQIPLSGFPDWSKTTAVVSSVCVCAFLKHPHRFMALRLRWYDLPVIVYSLSPLVISPMNNLGIYDGLSWVLDELMRWGLPYFIGRAYLADAGGNRQLTLGLAIGGMLYVPLCLIELRMSPMIRSWVYGFNGARSVDFSFRYGGYRPMVFLANGLETGWWMCCASFAAFLLWKSGTVKRLYGFPMGPLTAILAVVSIACKSTGALIQIALGFFLVYASRWLKKPYLVWALMAIPPTYCIARPTGIWTGQQVVAIAESLFGGERAQSLGYRFEQEEILMRSALQRPFLGFGRDGGFNPPDASGKSAVADGYWIIIFGWMGMVGLTCINLILLLPTALFLCRFRPKTWLEPEVAPATALAIILPLFMLDNLSNAMINPFYAIATGTLAGYRPKRRVDRPGQERLDFEGLTDGDHPGPRLPGLRGPRTDASRAAIADRFEAEANLANELGRAEAANDLYQRAIQTRQAVLDAQPSVSSLDRLARSHAIYARFLTRLDQIPAAIEERNRALFHWSKISDAQHRVEIAQNSYSANLNDLAWLLISQEQAAPDDVDRAILLAEEAVTIAADHAPYWNTLGIARYRRGDHHKAIFSLSRSVSLDEAGGSAFDFYYLALANRVLGYAGPAAEWIGRAEAWTRAYPEMGPFVNKVRAEALAQFAKIEIPQSADHSKLS